MLIILCGDLEWGGVRGNSGMRLERLLPPTHPTPAFVSIHLFVGWQGPVPTGSLPPPTTTTLFAFSVSSVVHWHPRAAFPFLGPPPSQTKAQESHRPERASKPARMCPPGQVPTRKAEPLPEGAQPGEKVEGTEASTSMPLAFGQHPVLDLGGPGTEEGGQRQEGEGSAQPRES